MRSLVLTAKNTSIQGSVSLPLSKSISNRALVISWLSGGKVRTGKLSGADDTQLLKKLLKQVSEGNNRVLHAGNAGTVFRFLTAVLAITPGEWVLEGDERMHHRPIGPLVDALRQLGATIGYTEKEGFPPLRITGKELEGGLVRIKADVSSQFISALLMIGPCLPRGITIGVEGEIASLPYLGLTMDMMKLAGTRAIHGQTFRATPSPYQACMLPSATDWSAAAPWYTLMSLAESGSLLIEGLEKQSLQGDCALPSYFIMFGVDTEWREDGVLLTKRKIVKKDVSFDLSASPDLAPSIIATAAAMGYRGHFTGLRTLRIKESDRIEALAGELDRNGFKCHATADTLSFDAQKLSISHPIETHNDHRIAMAFAPLAISGKRIVINEPDVVAKSYPGFWDELGKFIVCREI